MCQIFELEKRTKIALDNSYIISYPFILSFFKEIPSFSEKEFVIGSHAVYGWMPTGLDLYVSKENLSFKSCAELLNKAKNEMLLTEQEITSIAKVVNNSLVGASKLLHFTNARLYPIWDSKIYRFVHNEAPHNYRVNDPKKYLQFIKLLSKIQKHEDFQEFHKSVNKKLGYNVTEIRAIELIMFLNS